MTIFCLSLCSETERAILDLERHGDVLAVIEGRDWREAREAAIRSPVMDAFMYRAGRGWMRRGAD